jgi:hypothetical protein
VENPAYTLEELEREVEIYNNFMANKERVSVDEWKELTNRVTPEERDEEMFP